MNVPDKIFQTHSWTEINIYMFVKQNMDKDGTIKPSFQQIADEFGTTRGKVRHLLEKFFTEGLLIRTTSAQPPHNLRTTSAQTTLDIKGSESDSRTTSAQPPHNLRTTSAQNCSKKDLQTRAHDFGLKLVPYMEQYGKTLIRAFYDYWTESNEGGNRMRFEKEKTFDIKRRLERWHKQELTKKSKQPNSDIGIILKNPQEKDYTKGLW